jgi:hypothetical protein
MDYQELVKYKLKKDILSYFHDNYITYKDILSLNDYNELIHKLVDTKVTQCTMAFKDDIKEQWTDERSRCCARGWFSHRETRCSKLRMNCNTDYCKIHQNILERNEKLTFGRYDEPKPLLNEKGTRIVWKDSYETQINIILRYHKMLYLKNNI